MKDLGKKVQDIQELTGKLSPVFSKSSFDDVVNEVLRENEDIRTKVIENPKYRDLLKSSLKDLHKKYGGPLYWGKIIDKWDRVTSGIGMACELIPGVGNVASWIEEIGELIPKGIYAVYYKNKTGDKKAIPYWAGFEAASFIPYVGDLVDWTNIYFNRARKKTKEAVAESFRKIVGENIESKVGELEEELKKKKNKSQVLN